MGWWRLVPVLVAVLVLAVPAGSAAPRHSVVLPEDGSSGDGEEVSAVPPLPRVTPGSGPTAGDAVGTTVTNSSAAGGVLDGLVDFFKEYMLLVVVVGSLAFVLLFIICAAVIVRQKHKASAYYPSSFPKKKYVDQRDKAGGPRPFNEVPEKNPEPGAEDQQHLDCNRQLQADILTAAQNLKPPPKTNGNPNPPEEGEEEGSKTSGEKQPAEPPPQSPGAEEAEGTTGAGGEGTPGTAQDGPPGPPSV